MKHLKNYWVYYTILAIVIIVIIVNWSTAKGIFASNSGGILPSNTTLRISSSTTKTRCACGSPCCSCGAGQDYGERVC